MSTAGLSASLLVMGYLVGSIPFAFVLARAATGVDIRRLGSGNVGAANVMRLTRPSIGAAVALLDVAKGWTAVWMASQAGAPEVVQTAAGIAAVLGHVYPLWLRFEGGKGVATLCGVFGALAPLAAVLAVAVFAATVWATRYVSLGSVVASIALGPIAYALDAGATVVAGAAFGGALVVYRHRSNLERLQAGTERRLGQRA